MSRHLLVTAGDDGSIHMWDTTGRSPKVSFLKMDLVFMRMLEFFRKIESCTSLDLNFRKMLKFCY